MVGKVSRWSAYESAQLHEATGEMYCVAVISAMPLSVPQLLRYVMEGWSQLPCPAESVKGSIKVTVTAPQ